MCFLGWFFFLFLGNQFSGYGWTLVSDSVPLNYICEISLANVPDIEVEQRDEGKTEEKYGVQIGSKVDFSVTPQLF